MKGQMEEDGEFADAGLVREDSPLRHKPSLIRHLKDFEEMQVWKDAQDLAFSVYQDCANLKDFSFVDQIKRAAVSVSNNIAEGAERVTSADFARFLDIAKGSTGEVRSMYHLGFKLGYFSNEITDTRCQSCKNISKQLGGFAKYLRNK